MGSAGEPLDILAETDVLVVGAGPCGGAAGVFLAHLNVPTILINRHNTTADTPRAHITNTRALECLRDVDLDDQCTALSTPQELMTHTTWAESMTGKELARIYSWGNDPWRKGEYELSSPCRHADLPKTKLEPLLIREASLRGTKVRFNTQFQSYEEKDGYILTTVLDRLTNKQYLIKSKYLFGADGANSRVARQLGLPFSGTPGLSLAINVMVSVDLSAHVTHRIGNLHWIMQPDAPEWGWLVIMRMVKPWTEWIMILFQKPGWKPPHDGWLPSKEEYYQRVKDLIGDDSIPFTVTGVSKWLVNEVYADKYQEGRVICGGDAVHRHPPINGLGSNTCIQDAHNLAWKLSYILKGWAHPSLLETYTYERQPVGAGIVKKANDGLRDHIPIWESLGFFEKEHNDIRRVMNSLKDNTPEAKKRRAAFEKAIRRTEYEFHAIGVESNQRYCQDLRSAICIEPEDADKPPVFTKDSYLYYHPTTYPGCRLPHAWLGTSQPSKLVSTLDLCGKGGFTLLTGIGGEKWRTAAQELSEKLGFDIRVYSIGHGCDYQDVYFAWSAQMEIDESGAILVRPDLFVGWRAHEWIDGREDRLAKAVWEILGYGEEGRK